MVSKPIPHTHKAVVYDKPGEISTKVIDVETPSPAAGEVLIRLYLKIYSMWLKRIGSPTLETYKLERTHSGVCHSDLGVMTNAWKLPFMVSDSKSPMLHGTAQSAKGHTDSEPCDLQPKLEATRASGRSSNSVQEVSLPDSKSETELE